MPDIRVNMYCCVSGYYRVMHTHHCTRRFETLRRRTDTNKHAIITPDVQPCSLSYEIASLITYIQLYLKSLHHRNNCNRLFLIPFNLNTNSHIQVSYDVLMFKSDYRAC